MKGQTIIPVGQDTRTGNGLIPWSTPYLSAIPARTLASHALFET
jgi:hypothetical protein